MKLINLENAIGYAKEKDYIKTSGQEKAVREVFAIATVEAVPIDVLDKIKDEIMLKDGLEEALEIIDKYKVESETYGYCAYHEIECDYSGSCIDCPHNTQEDAEWFRQDEESAESEDKE